MEITRIILKRYPTITVYIGYFEGPRMTVALRQEISGKIIRCVGNEKKAIAAIYNTMRNFGYNPIDTVDPIDYKEEFLIMEHLYGTV